MQPDDINISDACLLSLRRMWPDWIPPLVPKATIPQPPAPAPKKILRKAPSSPQRVIHRTFYPLPDGLIIPVGTYWNTGNGRIAVRVSIARKMKHVCLFPPTQAGAAQAAQAAQLARRLRDEGYDIDEIKQKVRAELEAL